MLMRLRARAEFRRHTMAEIAEAIRQCEAGRAVLLEQEQDEDSRTALSELDLRLKELHQAMDLEEYKHNNAQNDIYVLMRAHRDELDGALTDSGTEEGVSSGSEDGSPRLSEQAVAAGGGGSQPFGRASETDTDGGRHDTSASASGGEGSVAGGGEADDRPGTAVESALASAAARLLASAAGARGERPERESSSGAAGGGEPAAAPACSTDSHSVAFHETGADSAGGPLADPAEPPDICCSEGSAR